MKKTTDIIGQCGVHRVLEADCQIYKCLLLSALSPQDLEGEINEALRNGWSFHGELHHESGNNNTIYLQMMIK